MHAPEGEMSSRFTISFRNRPDDSNHSAVTKSAHNILGTDRLSIAHSEYRCSQPASRCSHRYFCHANGTSKYGRPSNLPTAQDSMQPVPSPTTQEGSVSVRF